ncbi:group I truncated hemoglobin [Tundrisphaera lichenicola]|uniref:group I truncated hemoglobin n=1 Tax=Tundrisphaera lichenicola TaxID=2029860 RepID=UPI003EB7FB9C
MIRSKVWSIPFVVTFLASTGVAQESTIASRELDAQIEKSIVQTINVGVPLYNGGDAAGCYRVYQGSLISLGPMLGYRPDLQAAIQKGLAASDTMRTYEQRAVALRSTLDGVRAGMAPRVAPSSLWSRLGGEPAVRAVVHDFVIRAATDPKVDFTRGGKYPLDADGVKHIEQLLVEQISSVSGGPLRYTGREMKPAHAGMAITEAQFDAIAGDLVAVLNSFKVAQREIDELVGIIATTKDAIVEKVRDTPPPPPVPVPAVPDVPIDPNSLWARLGGEPAIRAVVHDFVAKAADDPKVDFTRGGKYPLDADGVKHIEQLLVEQISSVSGGPLKYTGREMKPAHAGMAITEAQFDAIAGDLVAVLKVYRVPQKEIDELIGIIATTTDAIVEKVN